jgi:hypothetical protein
MVIEYERAGEQDGLDGRDACTPPMVVLQTGSTVSVQLSCSSLVCLSMTAASVDSQGSLVKSYIAPRAITSRTHAILWESGEEAAS